MEESFTLLNEFRYKKSYRAGSVTGNEVDIIGEAVYRNGADGKLYDCYLYNIVGYTPKNGKPFVSRKENIYILEPIKESREQTSVSQIAVSKSKPFECSANGMKIDMYSLQDLFEFYQASCTAEYINENYGIPEQEALKLGYQVREQMDKYGMSEEDVVRDVIRSSGLYDAEIVIYGDFDEVELRDHLRNNGYNAALVDNKLYVCSDELCEIKTILKDRYIQFNGEELKAPKNRNKNDRER